jgi:hypothetical protein
MFSMETMMIFVLLSVMYLAVAVGDYVSWH